MWRIATVLLVALISGNAYSSDKPNLKTAETKDPSNTEQRGSDTNPLTIKVLPTKDADDKAAQEEKYRNEKAIQDEKLSNATVALAWITGLLAIFTGGLWWATLRLARDAKKTALQQAIDMQASLATAQQSADAAKQANALARESLEITQRARISIENVLFDSNKINYRVVNTGAIPATGVRISRLAAHSEGVFGERTRTTPNQEGEGSIIRPNGSIDHSFVVVGPSNSEFMFTQEEWNKMYIDTLKLQIGIQVAYWDGFHHTHHTEKWFRYDKSVGQWLKEYEWQD